MTTKKNLVKSMFMNILTAGFFAAAFTVCTDDVENEAMAVNSGPNTRSFELTSLEQYSYSVPVKVDVEGDWEIDLQFSDENNHFCYALPNKGHGPQTIKLCMLDNWTEKRNEGEMIIRDLSNSNNSKSFRLMQKSNLDNPEFSRARALTRAESGEASEGEEKKEEAAKSMIYSEGLRKFAIGYGYNCSMAPGFSAVSTNPILCLEKIAEQKNDAGAHVCEEGNISSSSYTGSSYRELYTKLTTEVTGKANKGSLTAEMKSTFTSEQKQSQKHTFVYTTANFKTHSAYISGVDPSNVREFLTDNARNAINGLSSEYDNSKEGFANLVNYYGSHLILQAELGGRMSYASTVDNSFTSNVNEARIIDVDIKGNYLKFRKCKNNVNAVLGERGTGAVYKDEDAPLKLKYDEDHQYPLVKIGKHIWLREEFSGYIPNGSDKFDRFGTKVVDGKVSHFYSNYSAQGGNSQMEYLTGDLAHFSIKAQTMDSGKLTSDPDKGREAMQIRLVMDM